MTRRLRTDRQARRPVQRHGERRAPALSCSSSRAIRGDTTPGALTAVGQVKSPRQRQGKRLDRIFDGTRTGGLYGTTECNTSWKSRRTSGAGQHRTLPFPGYVSRRGDRFQRVDETATGSVDDRHGRAPIWHVPVQCPCGGTRRCSCPYATGGRRARRLLTATARPRVMPKILESEPAPRCAVSMRSSNRLNTMSEGARGCCGRPRAGADLRLQSDMDTNSVRCFSSIDLAATET